MKAVRLLVAVGVAAALVGCDRRPRPTTNEADESARPRRLSDDETILERAQHLADDGDLATAHAALETLPPASELQSDPRVTTIEDAWADKLAAQARDDESDDHGKRLFEQIAAAPRVSASRRQRAIEQIVALDRRELKPLELGTAGSTPSAAMGGVVLSGGETVIGASTVIRGLAPTFRRCYNAALATDPTAAGSVRLTLNVGPTGEVLGATTSKTVLPASVVTCVRDALLKARFSAPSGGGGGGATLIVPVSFVAQ